MARIEHEDFDTKEPDFRIRSHILDLKEVAQELNLKLKTELYRTSQWVETSVNFFTKKQKKKIFQFTHSGLLRFQHPTNSNHVIGVYVNFQRHEIVQIPNDGISVGFEHEDDADESGDYVNKWESRNKYAVQVAEEFEHYIKKTFIPLGNNATQTAAESISVFKKKLAEALK
jgi:hypothetical protein